MLSFNILSSLLISLPWSKENVAKSRYQNSQLADGNKPDEALRVGREVLQLHYVRESQCVKHQDLEKCWNFSGVNFETSTYFNEIDEITNTR